MTAKIQIRNYHARDKAAVLNLLRLNTPTYFAPQEEEDLSRYLDEEVEQYYVLLYDGEIVGAGGINYDENRTVGIISWDIFHPDYQGKSLGTELLQHRLGLLRATPGIRRIVVRTSQLAFQFYEKNGFERTQIHKDYWAPGLDMYMMEMGKL